MTPTNTALSVVSAEPPQIPVAQIERAVEQQFGLQGDFSPLVGERDQNLHLKVDLGAEYVVKVASAAEPTSATDFQIEALLHLEKVHTVLAPCVVRTLDGRALGSIEHDGTTYRLRLVSYLAGELLTSTAIDPELARDFGAQLASLDIGLKGFSHEGETPNLLWDLQRAAELRDVLGSIDDPAVLERVTRVIDDFDEFVAPELRSLRAQVIHGDANPENVLIDASSRRVTGFIDFGDMVRAPLVIDVAIAASYLRSTRADVLEFIVPFVVGYHAKNPLQLGELVLMFDLVRARLATTITLLYWRLAARDDDDPYRQKTLARESGAHAFLSALDALGRGEFLKTLRHALRL